jgi:hypothetical protein
MQEWIPNGKNDIGNFYPGLISLSLPQVKYTNYDGYIAESQIDTQV